jgi:hypothetical protein
MKMKKKDLKRIFASFLVASIALTACNSTEETKTEPKKEEVKQEETETEDTQAAEIVVEDTVAAKQVAVFTEMKTELEKMKDNQPVDWDLVVSTYQSGLQGGINEVEGEFDQMISAALEGGKTGELEANVARQIVDKVTQSYFYQKNKSLLKEASTALAEGKAEDAKLAFEQVKHLAETIFIPTATKRDSLYQLTGEASIVENINAGLTAQEDALNANNAEDFNLYIQLTDKSIYRSYYLASYSYAEKITAAVKEGKDATELKIMQAEGWGFLQAIKGSLSGGDEAATTKINTILSLDSDPTAINADEVNSLFLKAISGKIKNYVEKAPASLDENKIADAKVSALEGNMFLKAMEIELTKKLGVEKTSEAFTHAEEWLKAISDNNKEEAKTHSDVLIQTIEQL